MRSQTRKMIRMSCSTRSTPHCSSSRSRAIASVRARLSASSSPAAGSSRSRNFGPTATARAMPTRRSSPCGSAEADRFARARRPRLSRSSQALALAWRRLSPAPRAPSSVFENVELGALGAGLSRRQARAGAWELLDSLGLRARANLSASALPHGDERRVGIARAVAVGPKFLLLDEPAAGLDDAESLALTEAIARLREELQCGVLLVEHDMRIIFRVCERIQVLDYGKSIAIGTPEEIRTNKRVVAAYLGAKGAEVAQAQ